MRRSDVSRDLIRCGTSIATHVAPTQNRLTWIKTMSDIKQQALQCRDAAQQVAQLSTEAKNALLRAMAASLEADANAILEANTKDMAAAEGKGTTGAML